MSLLEAAVILKDTASLLIIRPEKVHDPTVMDKYETAKKVVEVHQECRTQYRLSGNWIGFGVPTDFITAMHICTDAAIMHRERRFRVVGSDGTPLWMEKTS